MDYDEQPLPLSLEAPYSLGTALKEKERSGANSKGFWKFLLPFAALLALILLNNCIVQLANYP